MQIEAAPQRTSGQSAADRGEYRQAAVADVVAVGSLTSIK